MTARQGVLEAIDFAVDEAGIASFASVDNGPAYGAHAFYAIAKPTVRAGVLVDVHNDRPRDQLLTVIDLAADRPGLRVIDGHAFDPATISQIGAVDAVFLVNVLLQAVKPDWDRVLEMYAPLTSCFLIANPQWDSEGRPIRLIELGRERFLEVVPGTAGHRALFDRLDDWYPRQQRPFRDSRTVWQWGITDAALEAKLAELGFELGYERDLGPFAGAERFTNKAFLFTRTRPAAARTAFATSETASFTPMPQ